jgi:enolase
MQLKEVKARKIKDSRGEYTIEVQIGKAKASSPSGKSTGKYETPCFRKSLDWNIKFLNSCVFNLEINKFDDLKKLETLIKKKAKLKDVKQFGANALFALESCILKALALEQKKELWQVINPKAKRFPLPVGNAIGGGLHSHNKDAPTFQEFLIIPQSNSPKKNFNLMKKIHASLKSKLKSSKKNDEGAWQTSLNNEQILEVLSKYKNIRLGVDVAASSFYKDKEYYYKNKTLNKSAQIHYINSLIKKYDLQYCEDPLDEEDFNGFSRIKHTTKNLVVGDDLTATQISRVKKAHKMKSMNAMIVKPNQNGSLVELKQIMEFCKKNKIKTAISHRSGETLDDALADLSFGFGSDFIKAGVSTKWREAKLKRLVEIEKLISKKKN